MDQQPEPGYLLSADTLQYLDQLSDTEKYGAMKYLEDEGHPLLPASDQAREVFEQRLTATEKDGAVSYLSSADFNRMVIAFLYPEAAMEWLWYQLKSPSPAPNLDWLLNSPGGEHPSNVHEMDDFVTKAMMMHFTKQSSTWSSSDDDTQKPKLLSGRVVVGHSFIMSFVIHLNQVFHQSLPRTHDGQVSDDKLLEILVFLNDEGDGDLGGRKITMTKLQPFVIPTPAAQSTNLTE